MSTILEPQPRSVIEIPFHKVKEGGTYLYWITENKNITKNKKEVFDIFDKMGKTYIYYLNRLE